MLLFWDFVHRSCHQCAVMLMWQMLRTDREDGEFLLREL